ncbi:uncharacterized protein LOC128165910 [Crassostrea angulata]|uniref:uncharacterized protein LOC128165910 n=1 Tax=Magallana angulata TaxID=2784310 RepID=UPI0022B1080A|nr:uncharacterized protein LOC128165910 [Crassostrea angulata]
MCEQCRDEHQKSSETKNHEVVSYQQRQRQLPEVKCQIHVNRYVDMLCEQCQVPVCSKCATKDHVGHTFIDLETVYAEKCAICLDEINKIEEYFLPTSQDFLKSIKKDSTEIKKIMDDIRASIKAEAESLKRMVDKVTSHKIEQVNEIEESFQQQLKSQDIKYNGYISYLHELVKKFHGYLSSEDIKTLMSEITTNLKIDLIPATTKPVPPEFTAGQYSKEDVTKLLGRVKVPDIKPEIRKIKPMETPATQLKPTGKQRQQNREKSDGKQTLCLSSSLTKVREYTVPGVDNIWHISFSKSGTVWGSDYHGNLVQTDLQGNQLQKIQTSGGYGYHTVTQDGDLIYTDRKNKVINRIKQDKTITEFIKTGDWDQICIHSSRINGDILVGMRKYKEAKVTRYKKTGKEIQNIQRDNIGQELYSYPHYITENINGDICTSDFNNRAVVVVNNSGQYRFSYTGQRSRFIPCAINKGKELYRNPHFTENIIQTSGQYRFSYNGQISEFLPFGICTDLLGHILVGNVPHFGSFNLTDRNNVHILDQNGQFLSLLLTQKQYIDHPGSLRVDDENNLHIGEHHSNTVTVHKYPQ